MTPFRQLDFLISTRHLRGHGKTWECFGEHQSAPLTPDPALKSELSESCVNQTWQASCDHLSGGIYNQCRGGFTNENRLELN